MGQYLNRTPTGAPLPAKGKADAILAAFPGAKEIWPARREFVDDLVCVLENGPFDAAGYAYSEQEMLDFAQPDGRRKRWLIVPGVKELAQ